MGPEIAMIRMGTLQTTIKKTIEAMNTTVLNTSNFTANFLSHAFSSISFFIRWQKNPMSYDL